MNGHRTESYPTRAWHDRGGFEVLTFGGDVGCVPHATTAVTTSIAVTPAAKRRPFEIMWTAYTPRAELFRHPSVAGNSYLANCWPDSSCSPILCRSIAVDFPTMTRQ